MDAQFLRVTPPPTASWQHRVLRQPAFDYSWHFHPEIELTLVTKGTGTRIVGDAIESYRPGHLTVIGSEVPHAFVSTPGTVDQEAVLVQFRRDFLGPDLFAAPELAGVATLLDATAAFVDAPPDLVTRVEALARLHPAARTLALLDLLLELADLPLRTLPTRAPLRRLSPASRRRLEQVCAYLQHNVATEIRLADVARVAHLSPAACSRFFRRSMGRTITEYVTELRVAAACQLLDDTDCMVAAIATGCGYANLSNFNRRFRLVMGQSPREYRRAVRDVRRPAGS